MRLRLLIDECLSPELVHMAVAAGHVESTCVRDRGWSGTKDWKLVVLAVEGDYTLVTHNAVDFRGGGPGRRGGPPAPPPQHPGRVCRNTAVGMDLERQRDLFSLALQELAHHQDLVNQAMEVFEREDGAVEIVVYDIPEPG